MEKVRWLKSRAGHIASSILDPDRKRAYSARKLWWPVIKNATNLDELNLPALCDEMLSGVDYDVRGAEILEDLVHPSILAVNHYHESAILEDTMAVVATVFHEVHERTGALPRVFTSAKVNSERVRNAFGIISSQSGGDLSPTAQMAKALTEGDSVLIAPTGKGEYKFCADHIRPGAAVASFRASKARQEVVPIHPISFFREEEQLILHASEPIFPDWDLDADQVDNELLVEVMQDIGERIACNLPPHMIEC